NRVVLVTLCNTVVSTAHWNTGKKVWRPNHQMRGELQGVTHWRPLPDPPTDAQDASNHPGLYLQGKCTDHIWMMEDGEEPHILGLRMDCGDSGAVYLTKEQAKYLSAELARMAE